MALKASHYVRVCLNAVLPEAHPLKSDVAPHTADMRSKINALDLLLSESKQVSEISNRPEVIAVTNGLPHFRDLIECFRDYSSIEPLVVRSGMYQNIFKNTDDDADLATEVYQFVQYGNRAVRNFLFKKNNDGITQIPQLLQKLVLAHWASTHWTWDNEAADEAISTCAQFVMSDKFIVPIQHLFLKKSTQHFLTEMVYKSWHRDQKQTSPLFRPKIELLEEGGESAHTFEDVDIEHAYEVYASRATCPPDLFAFAELLSGGVDTVTLAHNMNYSFYDVKPKTHWVYWGARFLENVLLMPQIKQLHKLTPEKLSSVLLRNRHEELIQLKKIIVGHGIEETN